MGNHRDSRLCANTGGETMDVCDDKCVPALDDQQQHCSSPVTLTLVTHARTDTPKFGPSERGTHETSRFLGCIERFAHTFVR